MANNKVFITVIIYTFYLYSGYLYVAELSDSYSWQLHIPAIPHFYYFDIAGLLIGGISLGSLLIKLGGKSNKVIGIFMISLNLIIIPLLLVRAIN